MRLSPKQSIAAIVGAQNAAEREVELPIYVTRPTLSPLAEMLPHLEGIWSRRILSNGGPLHQQLESALGRHLGVLHVCLFANATLALIAAFRVLGLRGQVITSPFSFVASAHAVRWAGCEPVFVDIDPETLNIDPAPISPALTTQSVAILPVHCYGHACDVDAIDGIASAFWPQGCLRRGACLWCAARGPQPAGAWRSVGA